MRSDRRQIHRGHRAALIAAVVGAVACALVAVTLPRFTDENYAITAVVELTAPLLYVACVVAVFRLSHRSKHTFWLLAFAPVALWPYLEFVLMLAIWAIRGGMV